MCLAVAYLHRGRKGIETLLFEILIHKTLDLIEEYFLDRQIRLNALFYLGNNFAICVYLLSLGIFFIKEEVVTFCRVKHPWIFSSQKVTMPSLYFASLVHLIILSLISSL